MCVASCKEGVSTLLRCHEPAARLTMLAETQRALGHAHSKLIYSLHTPQQDRAPPGALGQCHQRGTDDNRHSCIVRARHAEARGKVHGGLAHRGQRRLRAAHNRGVGAWGRVIELRLVNVRQRGCCKAYRTSPTGSTALTTCNTFCIKPITITTVC